MSARLRWYLPTIQILLALVLGYLGSIQFAKKANGGILLDYVAPAEYVLHMINMPAALVISAITRSGGFQIGLEHSPWVFFIYVVLIGLLWYLIGRSFSHVRESADGRPLAISCDILLLLLCLASILLSLMPLFMPVSVLFGFAAFVWDGVLFVLAGRRLFQRYRSGTAKAA